MLNQRDNWHLTDRIEHESGKGDPFAAAIRTTRMPMVITDPRQDDNPIVFANQAFQDMSGYELSEIIGRNCRFLQGPDTDPATVRQIRKAIETENALDIDILNYRKDGTTFWNALHISPVQTERGETQFFFASQVDVTDRVLAKTELSNHQAELEKEVEQRVHELRTALDQKTTLIHEVDHRVKNNLAMISSLIQMKTRRVEDEAARSVLQMLQQQVDTVSSVHSRLYLSEDYDRFDLGAFLKGLAEDLIAASNRQDIQLDIETDNVDISPRKATAIGLLLTEVITNALKHAFNGDGPHKLTIRLNEGAPIVLTIADNGPGYDLNRPQSLSMGRKLTERLAKQIDATTRWRSDSDGTFLELQVMAAERQ